MSDLGSNDSIGNVYSERNLAAMAFGMAAKELGWRVGWTTDFSDVLWPILVVDTPNGQVSWHIPADEATADLGKYEGKWDGHTTEEKNARLHSYFTANTPIPAKQGEGLAAAVEQAWFEVSPMVRGQERIKAFGIFERLKAAALASLTEQDEGQGLAAELETAAFDLRDGAPADLIEQRLRKIAANISAPPLDEWQPIETVCTEVGASEVVLYFNGDGALWTAPARCWPGNGATHWKPIGNLPNGGSDD